MRIFRTVCCSMRFKNDLVEAGGVGARARARCVYFEWARSAEFKAGFPRYFCTRQHWRRCRVSLVDLFSSSLLRALSLSFSLFVALSLALSFAATSAVRPCDDHVADIIILRSSLPSLTYFRARRPSGPVEASSGFFHSFIFPPAPIASRTRDRARSIGHSLLSLRNVRLNPLRSR